MIQGHVHASAWRFESSLRHQHNQDVHKVAKKSSAVLPSAKKSKKRCQWQSQCCSPLVTTVDLPFSTSCTVTRACSHPSTRPNACQNLGSRNVSSMDTINVEWL